MIFVEGLTGRLERLERENHRWMLAAGIAYAALALLILLLPAPGTTTVIKSERVTMPGHGRPPRLVPGN